MSDMIYQALIGIDKGRLIENLIFLGVLIAKVGPHLSKIESNLKDLATEVKNGFKSGEDRFSKIERRIERIEDGRTPQRHEADV
jgi:hypothetical protein